MSRLDIELGTEGGCNRRVIEDVFSDYKEFIRNAIEEGWVYKSNKSKEYGKIDQSHLTHINQGCVVLLNLYRNLPESHYFVDEQMLRESIALFAVHDYHKLRPDKFGEEDFDITKSEARLFVEKLGVDKIADVDIDVVRGVMAAHHVSDDEAKKNEIRLDYLDEFHFVLLADALASSETIEEAQNSSTRKRAHWALGKGYSIFAHTLAQDMGEFGNAVNQAVSTVLEDMGFFKLKPFNNGCVYVETKDAEFESDGINQKILEETRKYAGKSRDDYSLSDAKLASYEISSVSDRYYEVGFKDVLFRGIKGTIEGIIERSVADSERKSTNNNEGNELYGVTKPSKDFIDIVEEYSGVNIHTDTRRVEGLSQGIHTIRMQFVPALVKQANGDKEWMNDEELATLKLFGLYQDDVKREKIKEVKREHHNELVSGDKFWNYKFLIGQYVYEEYCVGYKPNELMDKLSEVVIENLTSFTSIDDFENFWIEDIKAELASWLGINIMFHSESGSETKLAEYRDNSSIVDDYITNPDKKDCAICNWGTTARKHENRLIDREKDEKEKVEVNITGAGEKEFVDPESGDSAICYACQIRLGTNHANIKQWGSEDDVLYAHVKPEYGYSPISAWMFKNILEYLKDDNTGKPSIEKVSEEIVNNEIIKPVSNVLSWDKTKMVTSLTSFNGAYKQDIPYGGRSIPLLGPGLNAEEVRDAISAIVVASVYSGMRVHISTTAISEVEYNTGELVTMSERVGIVFQSFDNSITLNNALEFIGEVATQYGEVECSLTATND